MIRWLSNPERLSRLLETILGGCLLAFLFFLANDVWFGVPQLDGKWNVQYDFRKSKLWQGMKCDFRVLVQQSNQDLKGTSEKISQTDREGKTYRYETAKRAQARFTGFVTKNYLRSDTISVHWDEIGSKMTVQDIHQLRVIDNDTLEGTFMTSRSEDNGKIVWKRVKE